MPLNTKSLPNKLYVDFMTFILTLVAYIKRQKSKFDASLTFSFIMYPCGRQIILLVFLEMAPLVYKNKALPKVYCKISAFSNLLFYNTKQGISGAGYKLPLRKKKGV